MQSLSLKQVFVRYVSHEMRSPLTVVLAGLELLRTDLNAPSIVGVDPSIFDLIDDMQSAGETSVSILNDLLNYEHMDSGKCARLYRITHSEIDLLGTLKLEQSWKPLDQLLAGKLQWATILAEKKHVNLTISDTTKASLKSDVSESGNIGGKDFIYIHFFP